MRLQALRQSLEARIDQGTLRLDRATCSGEAGESFAQLPDSVPGAALTLAQVSISIDEQASPPQLLIAGTLNGSWPLPGSTGLAFVPEAARIAIGDDGSVTAQLSGRLPLTDADPARMVGTLCTDGSWRFAPDAGDLGRIALADLLRAAGVGDASAAPEGVAVDAAAAIRQLQVEAAFGSPQRLRLAIALALQVHCALPGTLPALDLESATLTLDSLGSAADSVSDYAVSFDGRMQAGDAVLQARWRRLGDTGAAVLELHADSAVPSLADLASWVGAADAGRAVVDALRAVGIDEFALTGAALALAGDAAGATSIEIFGQARIGGAPFELYGRLPQGPWVARLAAGETIDLVTLAARFLPGTTALPALAITGAGIAVDIGARSLALQAMLQGSGAGWQIELGGTRVTPGALKLSLDHVGGAQPSTRAVLEGSASVAGAELRAALDLGDAASVKATLKDLDLAALIGLFIPGAGAPDLLPAIRIPELALTITPSTGELTLSGRAIGPWPMPGSGSGSGAALRIDEVTVELNRAPGASSTTCTITVRGAAPALADGVAMPALTLSITAAAGGGWAVAGTASAVVHGLRLDLTAGYEVNATRRVLHLDWLGASPMSVLAAPGIATLTLQRFGVLIDAAGGLGVAGRGRIALGAAWFESEVDVVLATGAAGRRLAFRVPDPQPLRAALGTPVRGSDLALVLDISDFGVDVDTAAGTWSIGAQAQGRLDGIPPLVRDCFPAVLPGGSLRADNSGIAFSCVLAEPLAPRFSLSVMGRDVAPGIAVHTIGARIGDAPQAWAGMTVSMPAAADAIFGIDDGGQPLHRVFNPQFALRLAIGRSLQLSLADGTSPLRALAVQPPRADGSVWTLPAQLGAAGVFSFRVPDFAFDGQRWRGGGGVETTGDLALPLQPLRWLLGRCGLPRALLDAMPAAAPLVELDLRSPDFMAQVERVLGRSDPVFARLAAALHDGIDRLPDHIAEYLTLRVPRGFAFDITVEPGGGFSFGFAVADAQPLKVLLPGIVGLPPLPGLVGLTLNRVAFGITGGTIGVLDVDGWLDQVDVASLTYALTTGEGRQLSNRLIVRRTRVLVPLEAPLPLPLFYDPIGWEYRDVFGIAMQLHASFPDPEPTLVDWLGLIAALLRFFTDPAYYLHAQGNLPPGLALDFTLQPTFLALPAYLGGAALGPERELPALSVSDTLARALDGIKAGNLGWVIQAVPLKLRGPAGPVWIRVGRREITFGPLAISAGWCITTADEFRSEVLTDPEAVRALAVANAGQMFETLPTEAAGRSFDKGFVVLLMGELAAQTPLAQLFAFRCQFGLALTGPQDFETGLRLLGNVGPEGMLQLGVEGRIRTSAADREKGTVEVAVEGRVWLTVLGTELALAGRLEVGHEHLAAEIALQFGPALALRGGLSIDEQGARIEGTLDWGGSASGGGVATSCTFAREGLRFVPVALRVAGFDAEAVLELPGPAPGQPFGLGFALHLPPSLLVDFKSGLKAVADEEVGDEVGKAYDDLRCCIAAVGSLEASLRSVQSGLPAVCDAVCKRIRAATTRASVERYMAQWAGSNIGRKLAVSAAKATANPEAAARNAAQPWIDKLQAAKAAAQRAIDEAYRSRLQSALSALIADNRVVVRIKVLGVGPLTVYDAPALSAQQVALVREGLDAIGRLPAATQARVRSEQILRAMPTREQVLAEVRDAVDRGIDAGVPSITSVGFVYAGGAFDAAAVELEAQIAYRGRTLRPRVTADLVRPDATLAAIGRAVATLL